MDRRKLEYLLKRVNINDLKEIYWIIDTEGINGFSKKVCNCLKTGDTMYGVLSPREREELDIEFMVKYMIKFDEINEICIKNKTHPLFKDPKNLIECEITREDLIKLVPEEELNKFFKVSDFKEYIPPVYDPEKEKFNNKKGVQEIINLIRGNSHQIKGGKFNGKGKIWKNQTTR